MTRHPEGTGEGAKKEAMRKGLWVAASLLVITALVMGCQQHPGPVTPSKGPTILAIMVESNTVEAGSSFIVSGSNFKPNQKVWVYFEYRASDRTVGVEAYCEADEDGLIHPTIPIPEDVLPGDYEVEIFIGKNVYDRKLIAALPIHVQAVKWD